MGPTAAPTAAPTTPAPTSPPTSSPTTLAPTTSAPTETTDAPTGAPTVCENDLTFRVNGIAKKSCNWAILKNKRRKNLCKRIDVNPACPVACGACCADDSTYTFTT